MKQIPTSHTYTPSKNILASSLEATLIQMPPQTNGNGEAAGTASPKDVNDSKRDPMPPVPVTMTDKVMSSTANLAQLLPTGTVLAYQALSPSFTNHGQCYSSNRWLTAGLVASLTASSVFFAFTDSIVGPSGKLYYGAATLRGFNVFNLSGEEGEGELPHSKLQKLRLRPLDFVHAFFTAVVFLTVAFSDVGLQNCFFSNAGADTKELLKNLPLGMAFLSSFVFLIFPTRRKGIGYNDTTPRPADVKPEKVLDQIP